jgi:hypothetical protein
MGGTAPHPLLACSKQNFTCNKIICHVAQVSCMATVIYKEKEKGGQTGVAGIKRSKLGLAKAREQAPPPFLNKP